MIDVEEATEEFRQRLESGYFVGSDEYPLSGKEMDDVLKAVNTVQKHQSEINLDDAGYDEGYKDGLNEAWNGIRKIFNMPCGEVKQMFGTAYYPEVIEKNTASEVLEKIKAYEQRLEVGDEVIHKTITKCKPHVITQIRAEWVGVLSEKGYQLTWEKKKVVKTGKHYDIQSILDGLKEDS
jgi:hypothetical protein